ncbi:hypothetical protein Htur_0766 [Haloterrigena turkmenica DSM 5511]|uniref:Uncharacterized protein n=1 Tax=Haloterrigena turkmenica (strain ATCC 51198 / DSM 5511 / JCM 9101 / NCIMB 13204 / VKM B-1734 / 4k) TaxID=543526 RepID=D2RX50_HALTV|nr:hypothetical protein [Haloterrigena turkmenica]ADB59662.1 hypothetical protein Htur_0766 [Haloterrigena turkmenica DSM 5511]
MTSSDDGGYVHDPSAFDEDGERTAVADDDSTADPAHPESVDREFDWRGWTVVGMIVLTFIVAPAAITFWPPDVGYRFALLSLPLFPAVLLALAAVWGTTRP